jgi:hypothetical protein
MAYRQTQLESVFLDLYFGWIEPAEQREAAVSERVHKEVLGRSKD